MKKLLSVLLVLAFLLPTTFVKVDAAPSSASKFNSEVNYIELMSDNMTAIDAMAYGDVTGFYPYTAVNGDILVYALGNTTGTYKCLVYNNSWYSSSVVDKTIAELVTAHTTGTHVAVCGTVYHVDGLETVDTEDDIYYEVELTGTENYLSTGYYYLASDITLQNPIYISNNATVYIDLCGHTIDLNGNCIDAEYGNLALVSCKDTVHKFNVDKDNNFALNENGTTTVSGGLVTSSVPIEDYMFAIACANRELINNVNFVGIHMEPSDKSKMNGIICSYFESEFEDVKIYDCNVNSTSTGGIIFCAGIGEVQSSFKDVEIKYCDAIGCSCSIYSYNELNIFDNVTISNNNVVVGFYCTHKLVLKNKVYIYDNISAGTQANLGFEEENFIKLDNAAPLSSNSKIGLCAMNTFPEGYYINLFDATEYAHNYEGIFFPDSNMHFSHTVQENTKTYYRIEHCISEQPTLTNGKEFILNEIYLEGLTVNYQWKNSTIKEIVPKTGETQDYVATTFLFHQLWDIGFTDFIDGHWYAKSEGGIVLDLQKGDIVRIVCADPSKNASFYLCEAPDYMADIPGSIYGNEAAFIIQKDGRFGVAMLDPGYYDVQVIRQNDVVKGQTTNQLTLTTPGIYSCIASIYKDNKLQKTVTSNPILIEGLTVNFIVPNSTINVPRISFVASGSTISKPADPSSIKVTGWYKEPELLNEWNFDTDIVTENTVLYAQYEMKLDIVNGSIVVNQADEVCKVIVGEGLDISMDNFKSFTINGVTFNKEDLTKVDPEDESKGLTNGTFTFEDGCIVITIPTDYLNNLALGEYDVAVELTGTLNTQSLDGTVLTGIINIHEKIVGTGVDVSTLKLMTLGTLLVSAIYVASRKKEDK